MRRVQEAEPSVGSGGSGGSTGPDLGCVGLFRTEYAAIVGLITVVVGDRAVAEDLTQDAFSRAHQHWDRIAGYERPGAWVRRVAPERGAVLAPIEAAGSESAATARRRPHGRGS